MCIGGTGVVVVVVVVVVVGVCSPFLVLHAVMHGWDNVVDGARHIGLFFKRLGPMLLMPSMAIYLAILLYLLALPFSIERLYGIEIEIVSLAAVSCLSLESSALPLFVLALMLMPVCPCARLRPGP